MLVLLINSKKGFYIAFGLFRDLYPTGELVPRAAFVSLAATHSISLAVEAGGMMIGQSQHMRIVGPYRNTQGFSFVNPKLPLI